MWEPELIEIIEGPTPVFQTDVQYWNWGILQTAEEGTIGRADLRTNNGEDIRARCRRAWDEGRPVQLDYPGEFGIRERVDVVAMRLEDTAEGAKLQLWLHLPMEDREEVADEDDDFGFA